MIDLTSFKAELEAFFQQPNAPSANKLSTLSGCPRNYVKRVLDGEFQNGQESRINAIRNAMSMYPNPSNQRNISNNEPI